MTEEEVGRQAEGEQEPVAPPVPTVSSGDSAAAGSAAPSFDADALADKLLAKLVPELDDRIDARFKSAKDKRFAKLSKSDEILELVERTGGDKDKIREVLDQNELFNRLDALEASIRSGGAVGTAPEPDIQSDTAEILQKAGISFDDPDVAKWASKSFTSEAQALADLRAIVTKRAKQGNVTPAATVGSKGAPVSISGDKEELLQQLENIQEGVYGSPMSPENMEKSAKIVAKLNELDPPVDVYDDEQFFKAKQKGYSMDWFSDIPGPAGLHE